MFKTRYKNRTFQREVIELEKHSYRNCEFRDCMIILRAGDTELKSCTFSGCKLILKGNALTIGKILKMFSGEGPLKVVDYDEEGVFHKIGVPEKSER